MSKDTNILLITKEQGGRLVLSDIKIYYNVKVCKLKCGICLRETKLTSETE